MTLNRVALVVLLALLCGRAGAQYPDDAARSARLDAIASSFTRDNVFMGTVLVAEGDKILLNKGYGQGVVEWNVPNVPEAKFRLGSLTKQFTATLVLLLQQDGKLNIHDPVSKYIPDSPKAWEKITLADLLGHTSGIPNFTNIKEFGARRRSALSGCTNSRRHFPSPSQWGRTADRTRDRTAGVAAVLCRRGGWASAILPTRDRC